MTKREIINFRLAYHSGDIAPCVIALCNDGTMFSNCLDLDKWNKIALIPQPEKTPIRVHHHPDNTMSPELESMIEAAGKHMRSSTPGKVWDAPNNKWIEPPVNEIEPIDKEEGKSNA